MNGSTLPRRRFLGSLALGVLAGNYPRVAAGSRARGPRVLLRSSWQDVNIGDIAHTPGMLALLERHVPGAEVTLWPNRLSAGVEAMLRGRFPRLRIARTPEEQREALDESDFGLHGSGPGLVGAAQMELWRKAGKPYGFGGITLNDAEIQGRRELLAGARFVFCRDTDSLQALRAGEVGGPSTEFSPDATFYLDLRDEARAISFLQKHDLEPGAFACFVPRLRWTPYWEEGRVMPAAEVARKTAENAEHREADHAKIREAIVAWVRQPGSPKALLCPEMAYQVALLRPLLYDPLPDDVKPRVVVRPAYWLPDEAASTYVRAAAVVSLEMHSPIIALACGTPAIHVRQPTDTRKGQMWRDVGLGDWLFEVDRTSGQQLADRLLQLRRDREPTRRKVAEAHALVEAKGRAMMLALAANLPKSPT